LREALKTLVGFSEVFLIEIFDLAGVKNPLVQQPVRVLETGQGIGVCFFNPFWV
jgi:hypothetical protein